MDKILLALLVTATGSLLLSAMRFSRVIVPRRARQAPGREPISEVKEQIDHVPVAPEAGAGGFEFRPLTVEERKEFKNSFYAEDRRSTSKPRVYLASPNIVP